MKQEQALRVAFQALTEIAIVGHLADTALAQTLPNELSVAGFGVLEGGVDEGARIVLVLAGELSGACSNVCD